MLNIQSVKSLNVGAIKKQCKLQLKFDASTEIEIQMKETRIKHIPMQIICFEAAQTDEIN